MSGPLIYRRTLGGAETEFYVLDWQNLNNCTFNAGTRLFEASVTSFSNVNFESVNDFSGNFEVIWSQTLSNNVFVGIHDPTETNVNSFGHIDYCIQWTSVNRLRKIENNTITNVDGTGIGTGITDFKIVKNGTAISYQYSKNNRSTWTQFTTSSIAASLSAYKIGGAFASPNTISDIYIKYL